MPPPPADPVSAEYCDELTRNSEIDSMLMISRATLSCLGSFTPVASIPSNVQLLSSTDRPTNLMDVCVPAPVLIAPGASIIRLDQCRPLSGSSLSCVDCTTVQNTGELVSSSDAAPRTVTTSCTGPTSSLMSTVRRSPTSRVTFSNFAVLKPESSALTS